MYQGFSYECLQSNLLSHFSTKTYVLGPQKNRRNETVLLSTKLYVKSDVEENVNDFTLKNCVYLGYHLFSIQI